jgi:transcriptional regulator with XRE-family HTH domain
MAKNRIKTILEQKGVTPYRLAQIAGVSQNRIYKIVNSPEIPPHTTWDTIKKIAKSLSVSLDELEDQTD